jgi:hypothetical protein
MFRRGRNEWNGERRPAVSAPTRKREEMRMYIGLGGLLILILILWLLGDI